MCQLLVSCVGFLFDLLAFLACGAAFALPHWVFFPSGFVGKLVSNTAGQFMDKNNVFMRNQYEYEGLLARAYPDGIWNYFWQNDFDMEKDLPDWHKAAQALYTFGIVILLSTVLLAFLHVACRCCCQKAFSLATVIGALIFASFVLIGAAVGVFTAFEHLENNVQIDATGRGQFYYSVYVACGGLLAALLSAVLFLCDGCQRQRPYDGYETARMI